MGYNCITESWDKEIDSNSSDDESLLSSDSSEESTDPNPNDPAEDAPNTISDFVENNKTLDSTNTAINDDHHFDPRTWNKPMKAIYMTNAELRRLSTTRISAIPKPPASKPRRSRKQKKEQPTIQPYDSCDLKESLLSDLRKLWEDINESEHKLFFIQYRASYGQSTCKWHVVAVDLDKMDHILGDSTLLCPMVHLPPCWQ